MIFVKRLALIGCLAAAGFSSVVTSASADPAADTKPSVADTKKPMMSDADKRAKAADCSKQANEKGLHGDAREKFRAACKRK